MDNKKIYNPKLLKALIKIFVILVFLIGIIDCNGYVGSIINYPFVFLFGYSYFIFYILAIIHLLLSFIFKKTWNFKLGIFFIGLYILFIGFICLINIENSIGSFKEQLNLYSDAFKNMENPTRFYFEIASMNPKLLVCGFVGNVIVGLLIPILGNVYGTVVVSGLMTIGLCFCVFYIVFIAINNRQNKLTITQQTNESEKILTINFGKDVIEENDNKGYNKSEDLISSLRKKQSETSFDIYKSDEKSDTFDIFSQEAFSKEDVLIEKAKASDAVEFDVFNTKDDDALNLNNVAQEPILFNDTISDNKTVVLDKDEKEEVKEDVVFEEETIEEVKDIQNNIFINNFKNEIINDNYHTEENEENLDTFTDSYNGNYDDVEERVYNYTLPPITLLSNNSDNDISYNMQRAEYKKYLLDKKLEELNINAHVKSYTVAPAFTRFTIEVLKGVKMNQFNNCEGDFMLALSAPKVTIYSPIPGTEYVGVDVPNDSISKVGFRECFAGIPYAEASNHTLVTLGKDISGKIINIDLNKCPHLLVAGATGSGKSVCLNSIIVSLIMRNYPNELGLIMIDPKKVELSTYSTIPHLLCPVVVDPKEACVCLKRVVEEMDERYNIFQKEQVKDIKRYNLKMEKLGKPKMKYIVVVIDEFMFLIQNDKTIEQQISQITALARSAGIVLVVATQRPSVDVITGVVKSNIPSRIAFAVSSATDSRVILDETGAEDLLGNGDMILKYAGQLTNQRIQGCFIDDLEVERVVEYLASKATQNFDSRFLELDDEDEDETRYIDMSKIDSTSDDIIYGKILEYLSNVDEISVSKLRRLYSLGQPRAARFIDKLYDDGYIGPPDNNKPRVVYRDRLPKNEQ